MFHQLDPKTQRTTVQISVDGAPLNVPDGIPLASALLMRGEFPVRTSPLGIDQHRAPYCMMGVCFECLVEIDGIPNQQSCLVAVRAGMVINRQDGAADIQRVTGKQHD